jgi:hypothetical protein
MFTDGVSLGHFGRKLIGCFVRWLGFTINPQGNSHDSFILEQ